MVDSTASSGIVGFDLDNTLINYQPAIRDLARNFGLPAEAFTQARVRTELRQRASGEDLWQEFQACLYTDGLQQALPAEGSMKLLHALRDHGFEVCIISHKTTHTQERFGARDLRSPASDWLRKHGLVPALIAEHSVFFEENQAAKVVTHPGLIGNVRMIHYQPELSFSSETTGHQIIDFEKIASWVIPS